MTDPATASDLARLLGISHTAILKAVKAGHIHREGRFISRREALEHFASSGGKFSDRARAILLEDGNAAAHDDDDPDDDDLDAGIPPLDDPSAEIRANPDRVFIMARAKEARFKADIRELEYKERIGELVPLAQVRSEAAKTAAMFATHLQTMPQRLAAQLENRSAREIESLLAADIQECLKQWQKCRYH